MDLKTIILAIVVILLLYFVIRYMTVTGSLSGLANAKDAIRISKDDLDVNDSSPASNFTYSIWFNIDTWNYRYGQPKIVFGRLDTNKEPCPSVTLGAMQNDLTIALACYPGPDNTDTSVSSEIHKCRIQNVPIQKWTHLLMSVYGKSLDIYIDGKLVNTNVLKGVPMTNKNYSALLCPDGGFSGEISKFKYFARTISPREAYEIYREGPGGNWLSDLLNQYKLKMSFLKDNEEINSFEI